MFNKISLATENRNLIYSDPALKMAGLFVESLHIICEI